MRLEHQNSSYFQQHITITVWFDKLMLSASFTWRSDVSEKRGKSPLNIHDAALIPELGENIIPPSLMPPPSTESLSSVFLTCEGVCVRLSILMSWCVSPCMCMYVFEWTDFSLFILMSEYRVCVCVRPHTFLSASNVKGSEWGTSSTACN